MHLGAKIPKTVGKGFELSTDFCKSFPTPGQGESNHGETERVGQLSEIPRSTQLLSRPAGDLYLLRGLQVEVVQRAVPGLWARPLHRPRQSPLPLRLPSVLSKPCASG